VKAGPIDEVLTSTDVSACFGVPVAVGRDHGRWWSRARIWARPHRAMTRRLRPHRCRPRPHRRAGPFVEAPWSRGSPALGSTAWHLAPRASPPGPDRAARRC